MDERLDNQMAGAFVGRGRELALLEDGQALPFSFIYGPGGIGKSTLLREHRRRLKTAGVPIVWIDGRERDAVEQQLSLAGSLLSEGGFLLFDNFEEASAFGPLLRETLAAGLGTGLRAVIAGRQRPGADWNADGWNSSLRVVRIGPLEESESLDLVHRRGLEIDDAARKLVDWAQGVPLVLVVAADASAAGKTLELSDTDTDAYLSSALLDLVAEGATDEDREVLAIAAIARSVDARLLAAVMPGVDGDLAEARLRELPFAEQLGTSVTLHSRIREAIRGKLVREDQTFERDLRRRVADHLHGRIVVGESRLSVDLAELIGDDVTRWGLAPAPSLYRASLAGPGDAVQVEQEFGFSDQEWWKATRRWFEQAPRNVVIVRDSSDRVAGYSIWAVESMMPPWSDEDPVLRPWLEHARSRLPLENVMFIRDARDRDGAADGRSPVISVGAHAILMRNQLASIRYTYGGLPAGDLQGQEFVRSVGYQRLEGLDVEVGDLVIRSFLNDMGPAGPAGGVRDLVYRDLGIPPPEAISPAIESSEIVRGALRNFHNPVRLASSPLARGGNISDRAESVRRMLRTAISGAFGDSQEERLQRSVLEIGYLDAHGGAVAAQQTLHLGRTAYFRRLADASERIDQYVLSEVAGHPAKGALKAAG